MKSVTGIFLGVSLVISTQTLYADAISDTYATGDRLTAGKLNNIKSSVNSINAKIDGNTTDIETNTADISTNSTDISTNASDISTNSADIATNAANISSNSSRITAIEAVTGVPVNFVTGYGLPFSADGNPKNVSITRRLNNDGTTSYHLRSRYATSTEQISIQGVLTPRPFIANYGFVAVDSSGNITTISNYLEAPLTSDYEDYVIEQSTFDTTTLAKTVTVDTGSELWVCGTTVGAIQVCNVNTSANGVSTKVVESIRVMELLGAGEIDGIAFTNLRGSQRTLNDSSWYEVRAKGIGRVLQMSRTQAPAKIIYYRVDGNTGGSLAGTPFAAGELLENFLH